MTEIRNMPDISVVICTYNRPELLFGALRSVCNQAVPPYRYEVIVVDNASSDRTRAVVEYCRRFHPSLRYLRETNVGLSHARNAGWQAARAPYVAYTDDDCLLPPHWLAVAIEDIATRHPAALGGPFCAFYLGPKPAWFKDAYASRDRGDEARVLRNDEFLWGNNMIFDRTLIACHQGFDAKFGMNGELVAYGEEGDLQRRMRAHRQETVIYYDPRLYVHHLVRDDQMTWSWILRAAIAKGRSGYLLSRADSRPEYLGATAAIRQATKVLATVMLDAARGLLSRNRRRYPYYQNYLYERVAWRLGGLGRIRAQRTGGAASDAAVARDLAAS